MPSTPSVLPVLPVLRALRRLSLTAVLFTSYAATATAQVDPSNETSETVTPDPSREVFASEERVTLVDVVVEVPDRLRRRLESGKSAEDLELTARAGSVALPIASIDVPAPGQGEWTQLIYLDASLSAEGTIPWAAQLLATRLEDLLALGPIEIILADPTPRRLLGSTLDAKELDDALAGMVFDDPGEGILTSLREEVVEAAESLGTEDRQEFERAVAIEESRLLTERFDLLLGELLLYPRKARKVVYWVSSGFDTTGETQDHDLPSPLSTQSAALAQTLAAYGWTTVPLLRPPPEAPLKPGMRIGKWRVNGVGGYKFGDPKMAKGPWILEVSMVYEEDRKPARGRASFELALALRADRRLPEAEDALRAALRWFHGDPRTSAEQAACWEQLAEVLHEQDRDEEARRAYGQVARLRPESEPGSVYRSRIQLPQNALDTLAEETMGRVVRTDAVLDEVLASLRKRVVVSLQLSGTSDGALLPLEIVGSGDQEIHYPRWLRRGTSERVSEVRGRLFLMQEIDSPEEFENLEVEVRRGSSADLEVVLYSPPSTPGPTDAAARKKSSSHRVSVALVDAAGNSRWSHHTAPSDLSTSLSLAATAEDGLLIVVVEDLASGRWGARIVDLPI